MYNFFIIFFIPVKKEIYWLLFSLRKLYVFLLILFKLELIIYYCEMANGGFKSEAVDLR
jgi:hypothetical protein